VQACRGLARMCPGAATLNWPSGVENACELHLVEARPTGCKRGLVQTTQGWAAEDVAHEFVARLSGHVHSDEARG
jgi:hypothetical protein